MDSRNVSPTVLLIEELDNDYSPKTWLEDNGYNVREVSNMSEAFDEIMDFTLEHRPSVILLNSNLPFAERSKTMHSLHEFADAVELPVVGLKSYKEKNEKKLDDEFVHVENFDLLKPLINSLISNSLSNRATV